MRSNALTECTSTTTHYRGRNFLNLHGQNAVSDGMQYVVTRGDRLRFLRTAAGMTQRELATAAGIEQTTVAYVETGRRTPRGFTSDLLTTALRVDPGSLDDDVVFLREFARILKVNVSIGTELQAAPASTHQPPSDVDSQVAAALARQLPEVLRRMGIRPDSTSYVEPPPRGESRPESTSWAPDEDL